MKDSIILNFKKKPSAMYPLLQTIRARRARFKKGKPIPTIVTEEKGFRISKKHLEEFKWVCKITDNSKSIGMVYPFTLVYSYIMLILSRKEMPFSLFNSLNTRCFIKQYRQFNLDETFDIVCFNSDIRFVKKGFEIDIIARLKVEDEIVWENIVTYYFRNKKIKSDTIFEPPVLESLSDAPVIKSWFFNGENRFKFARISGDTNGIHYGGWYAKKFGFERDFAQPIRVMAKCIDNLPEIKNDYPHNFMVFMKGPVYYNKNLSLKYKMNNSDHYFDLYCEGNHRPCICGKIFSDEYEIKESAA